MSHHGAITATQIGNTLLIFRYICRQKDESLCADCLPTINKSYIGWSVILLTYPNPET